jgi:hypothetical protein
MKFIVPMHQNISLNWASFNHFRSSWPVKCAFSVSQKRGQSFFEIVLDFYRATTGQREIFTVYRTRAIITLSWFETALDYKPQILGPTFLVYVLKWSVILTSLALKDGVKDIQTAGYNGARTVDDVELITVALT